MLQKFQESQKEQYTKQKRDYHELVEDEEEKESLAHNHTEKDIELTEIDNSDG